MSSTGCTLDQTSSTLPAKMTRRATSYVAESALTSAISAEVRAVLRVSPSGQRQLRDQVWRAVSVGEG